jgi:YD repeat-containing protein
LFFFLLASNLPPHKLSAKRTTALLDGRGNSIVSFTYNNNGYFTTQTYADGNVTQFTYDANGNELSELRVRPTHHITTHH